MVSISKQRKNAFRKLNQLSSRNDIITSSIAQLFPFGISSLKPRNPAYDRDIVITSCALLEQSLESAILQRMRLRDGAEEILFSGDGGVLNNLSSKIKMAYLLRLVGPKTKADLECIRQIRNAFAHTRKYLDFEMQEFKDALSFISAPDRWKKSINVTLDLNDQRECFIRTTFELFMYLIELGFHDGEAEGAIMIARQTVFSE